MESFSELSFEQMLKEFPRDTQSTFSEIFKDLYIAQSTKQKKDFIEKLVATFADLISNSGFLGLSKKDFQIQMNLIPQILSLLVSDIKTSSFLELFEVFNNVERSNLPSLMENCISLGKDLILKHPSELGKLIVSQTKQISATEPLITPIVFVAECARVSPHLSSQIRDLESDLERLLVVQDKNFLTNLAKQIRHLMSFIKDPEALLEKLFNQIIKNKAGNNIIGNSYFCAGLLKGMGIKFFKKFGLISRLNKVFDASTKKDYKDIKVDVRKGCVILAEALWDVYNRLLEPSLKEILRFLLKFLGDSNEPIRELTGTIMKKFMFRISEFGIKQILPILIEGTTDKNSKTKYNSILALGSIANCGTKQLSQSLPIIVPKLTEATNDTNDLVNNAAKESLSLILGTIRSPEVSSLKDILIKSLSDPFHHNDRSLEALLKTKFEHALDGPSLSLIVPIALYGCKNITSDLSKKNAAKLIANMIDLVPNAAEFLPHLDPLLAALTDNLKELSPDVRAVSSKAFYALTKKFKDTMGMNVLKQLKAVLETETANSSERAGYAQAFGEVMFALGPDVAKSLIPKALMLTKDSRDYIRESFLSVFVYLPIVMGNQYTDYVQPTINSVVESISHEKERIRNLAIKSLKIVIQNYLQNDFQVLLRPLFEGCLSDNANKKNSSLILLGDIIQMLINDDQLTRDVIYTNYSRIFSLFYIIKNDDSTLVRDTAKNIYKTFIPNTQRCLRIIFEDLHECFIELFSRDKDCIILLARNGLREFGNKYADSFASEMLKLSQEMLNNRFKRYSDIKATENWNQDSTLTREITKLEKLLCGQSKFICEFVANCNGHALRKIKNMGLVNINDMLSNFEKEVVWYPAFDCLKIFVERENDVKYVVGRLKQYSDMLTRHEIAYKNDQKEGQLENDVYEKLKKFYTVMLASKQEGLLKETSSHLFSEDFYEWQFEVILANKQFFGKFLYIGGILEEGLQIFFQCYKNRVLANKNQSQKEIEYLQMNKFTINILSIHVDQCNIDLLLTEFEEKLEHYSKEKNGEMIILTIESLHYFFEKMVLEDVQFPFTLCSLSLQLISYEGQFKEMIYTKIGEFLEVLFRFFNKENCSEVMQGIYITLTTIVDSNPTYEGLKNPKVILCLFNLISEVLTYSTPEPAIMAIRTTKFLIRTLPQELLIVHKKLLYASLLRLMIYKYSPRRDDKEHMKRKLFKFLNFLLKNKYDMGFLSQQFYIYIIILINAQFKIEEKNKEKDEKQKQIQLEIEKEEQMRNPELTCEVIDTQKKKPKKIKLTLRQVIMQYTINLSMYFGHLPTFVSNWHRKVRNNSEYYSEKLLSDFVEMVEKQEDEKVSQSLKQKTRLMIK